MQHPLSIWTVIFQRDIGAWQMSVLYSLTGNKKILAF